MLSLDFLSSGTRGEVDSRVALVMSWSPIDGIEAIENLQQWSALFGYYSTTVRVCVFSSQDAPREELALAGLGLPCWHTIGMPPEWDRYLRSETFNSNRFNQIWSPWGFKSGPNFQFFEVLASYPHEQEYILQLEGDTIPVGGGISVDNLWRELEEAEFPWVFGSFNPQIVEKNLNWTIRGHINGAALYRVGDSGMRSFADSVWKDSLLANLALDPNLAYDVLTAPGQWSLLPDVLTRAWNQVQGKFWRSPRMINASTIYELPRYVLKLLKETGELYNPWFLHYGKRT